MSFSLDLTLLTSNPIVFIWWFMISYGWIFPVVLFLFGLVLWWQNYIRNTYRVQRKYILLAIDVPKANEQSLRAVENIFSHIAGAQQSLKTHEKFWTGEINDSFSFEIVSLGGYIQFIIHTRDVYRDLVEATIYAQYPDAEITEVENYTQRWNIRFPNDNYDLYGTELKLARKEVYPIVTYPEFEDKLSQELKDPMASMLEALSRIGPGEEIWIQFVVTPADNAWISKGEQIVKKLAGAKTEHNKDIVEWLMDFINYSFDSVFGGTDTGEKKNDKKNNPSSQMQYLTPGKKDEIAAIEHKMTKIGFFCRIRFVYIAQKQSFLKQRGQQGILGGFKQFNNLGLNHFIQDKRYKTSGIFWYKRKRLTYRKNKILRRFKDRAQSLLPGQYGFILNTEELATLWHFPVMTVKAPLVKKTEAKKSEPPISLPVEHPAPLFTPIETPPPNRESAPTHEPPENLPIM